MPGALARAFGSGSGPAVHMSEIWMPKGHSLRVLSSSKYISTSRVS